MSDLPKTSRRHFIKMTAVSLATAPFACTMLCGTAHAAEMVSTSDPTAAALGYVEDATKAEKRTDTAALCSNCNFYSGKAGEDNGPCALFQNKHVKAGGWCTAWAKKAG